MSDTNEAAIGAGTTLSFYDELASPVGYYPISDIRSIQGPSSSKQEVESTTLDSVAVERISGLPDGDQITIVFADNRTTKALVARFYAMDVIDFKEQYDDDIFSPVQIDYYSVVPLKNDGGNTTPNALKERTFVGRITGGVSGTDPHEI